MMISPSLKDIIDSWQLPPGDDLLACIEQMIQPAVLGGYFVRSPTAVVSGFEYHLGGAQDTRELADLSGIRPDDRVLDVCCYLGAAGIRLGSEYGCRVVGVDIGERFIYAAQKIAQLASMSEQVEFLPADGTQLPFAGETFSVVWNQASLPHEEAWLQEFDRVLAPGGRLALTFDIRKANTAADGQRWSLEDFHDQIEGMGYSILHAEDISQRDIRIGWQALETKLQSGSSVYEEALGKKWVEDAHTYFANNIQTMQADVWGNGRLVASKGTIT
jgi:SAM-dependent methyltransferase